MSRQTSRLDAKKVVSTIKVHEKDKIYVVDYKIMIIILTTYLPFRTPNF